MEEFGAESKEIYVAVQNALSPWAILVASN
jgi:hypothetical protein